MHIVLGISGIVGDDVGCERGYVKAHTERMTIFSLSVGLAKKAPLGWYPGNNALTVKSIEGPDKEQSS